MGLDRIEQNMKNSDFEKAFEGKHVDANYVKNLLEDNGIAVLLKNDAAIGGLKVVTENGWFAARPSGTEDIYKIYAESFIGESHLDQIQQEAQEIVNQALRD